MVQLRLRHQPIVFILFCYCLFDDLSMFPKCFSLGFHQYYDYIRIVCCTGKDFLIGTCLYILTRKKDHNVLSYICLLLCILDNLKDNSPINNEIELDSTVSIKKKSTKQCFSK